MNTFGNAILLVTVILMLVVAWDIYRKIRRIDQMKITPKTWATPQHTARIYPYPAHRNSTHRTAPGAQTEPTSPSGNTTTAGSVP